MLIQKEDYELAKTIHSNIQLIIEGQKLTHPNLQRGFIRLANQNNELFSLNKEFNELKREQEEKAERRKAWSKRKRLPKRQPITPDIYKLLMQEINSPTYTAIRLRIAICVLAVTGIRVNQLLPLKVWQLKTLIESDWIEIDRSKRGPTNHKVFLTAEEELTSGKKMLNYYF